MTSLRIQIVLDGGRIGPGKIRLLELIRDTGSISEAAKKLDMSYRRAWLLVRDINALFGDTLVATRAGARGGALLTTAGEAVIAAYRTYERECLSLLRREHAVLLAAAPAGSRS
jgi:molybdate transport system regulatory protein